MGLTTNGGMGMKNAAARSLAAVTCGIMLARVVHLPWWFAATAAVLGIAVAAWSRGFSLYAALAALSLLHAQARAPRAPDPRVHELASFNAVVVDEGSRAEPRRLTLELNPPWSGRVVLWPRDVAADLAYGDVVSVRHKIRPPDSPRNPGLPDFNMLAARRGIVGSVAPSFGEVTVIAGQAGSPLVRVLVMPLRRVVLATIERFLPGDEGALLAGLLLGGGQGLPGPVRQAFSDAGLVHILAVSGMNVGIVVVAVWMVLAVLGIRGWWRFGLSTAAVVVYLALVGWSAAPARAGLMAALALLSVPTQRRLTPLASLCSAGIILLVIDPLTLFDAGAQLSFAATGGIVLAVQRLGHLWRLVPRPGRLLRAGVDAVAVSMAATVATAPLLLHHFYRFQPLAFISSLAVVPLVSIAMPLGLVVLVTSRLSAPLAGIFAESLRLVLWLLLRLVAFLGRLDWAIVEPGRLSWAWVLWFYALVLLALGWQKRWARLALAVVLAAGLGTGVLHVAYYRARTEVLFLDPGQGDAVLLSDTLGRHVVVDAGVSGPGVLRDVLRSRGIRTLDAVVITHPDRDHYGGLLDLSERVRVRRLLVPTLVSRETAFTRLVARLRDAGTQVLVVGQGSELTGAGFGMRFLWPDGVTRSMYEAGLMPTNAASLVAMVEHAGFRMLLTSDMEDVASLGEVRADLLKSPHHGSRKGNLDTLFRAVQPGYVVVMGRYPTPAGLEQRPDPAKCVNTRRDGGFTVRFSRAGPALVPYGGR